MYTHNILESTPIYIELIYTNYINQQMACNLLVQAETNPKEIINSEEKKTIFSYNIINGQTITYLFEV